MSSTAYPPSSVAAHLAGLSSSSSSSAGNGNRGEIVGNNSNEGGNNSSGFIGGNSNCNSYGGVAVMPPFSTSALASGGFYNYQEISSSGSGGGREHSDRTMSKEEDSGNDDLDDAREMTDYQRSFSEGRLVDSDFSREALSQSHDSVFSESATASSLSIVLKAELFDVLRKRRNRPDASDEDLGLPRSPTTPQRKDQTINTNQSEVSSLSLLSMASSDLDDESSSIYGSGIGGGGSSCGMNTSSVGLADKTSSSISSKLSQDTSKTSDELDLNISAGTRLSHSAAKHKMAIRPKKKGPTRHRRPIESTVLPTTPEVNEDLLKAPALDTRDSNTSKHKSQSLSPGVNSEAIKETPSPLKLLKMEKVTASNASIKNIAKNNSTENDYIHCTNSNTSTLEKKDEGFFRRLLHRNSKKVKKQQEENDRGVEESINVATRQHLEHNVLFDDSKEYNQNIEETRKEIRKEILSEAKSSLSAMLNTFILSPDHEMHTENDREQEYEREMLPKIHKPKSGPAARQRVLPKDLSNSPLPEIKNASDTSSAIRSSEDYSQSRMRLKSSPDIQESPVKYFKFSNETISSNFEAIQVNQSKVEASKISEIAYNKQTTEELQGPKLIKSFTEESFKSHTNLRDREEHFEKKLSLQPKIVGLSPFQQKISRAEVSTLDHGRPIPKQRKSVEKSKSFRYYSEGVDDQIKNTLKKHENMPSLPDLSLSRRKTGDSSRNTTALNESDFMPLSLSFEINDNNLLNQRRDEEEQLPLSQGIYTKNIILTTSKPSPMSAKPVINSCNQNITEIEENIDKLVKSPFVTVLRKSATTLSSGDAIDSRNNINISTASVKKTDAVVAEQKQEKTEKVVEKIEKPTIMEATTAASTAAIATVTMMDTYNNKLNSDTKAVSTENLSKIEYKTKDKRGNSITDGPLERKSMEKLESTESLITKVELRNRDKRSTMSSSSSSLIKSRRNSSVLEKFESCNQIPEFMKIQLNRVDCTRPKSNVVLAKNIKEPYEEKDVIRRSSSENVEISDNKPPLPPSTDTTFSSSMKRCSSNIPATSTQSLTSQRSMEDNLKSPSRKLDDENITILRNSENTQSNQMLYERKKSVTDEKIKYEKKIEELRFERKKSYSDERKISIDDDNNFVVLRNKKSFTTANNNGGNKEDTPELMKVFARRSLKLKDEEMQTFDDIDKMNSNLKKLSKNLDSDKENQSSSEEKLDKLPKVEITIQQQQQLQQQQQQQINNNNNNNKSLPVNCCNNKIITDDNKNRNSSLSDLIRKPNTMMMQTNSSSSTSSTPTKSYISPIRYSNIVGYRNQTNFNNGKSMHIQSSSTIATHHHQTPLSSSSSSLSSSNNIVSESNNNSNNNSNSNSNNNNSNNSNCSSNSSSCSSNSSSSSSSSSNNNNNNNNNNMISNNSLNKRGLRHTIGSTNHITANTSIFDNSQHQSESSDTNEFKGILQRRAEWEKRAKEALK